MDIIPVIPFLTCCAFCMCLYDLIFRFCFKSVSGTYSGCIIMKKTPDSVITNGVSLPPPSCQQYIQTHTYTPESSICSKLVSLEIVICSFVINNA